MQYNAETVEQYLEEVPKERLTYFEKLRNIIRENIPEGFEEEFSYGMIGYVVPHSIYPKGYHASPDKPLPFVNLASQKNHIALYHMGLYSDPKLLDWFQNEYKKHSDSKLDIGKSCIRFKNPKKIPFELIGELMKKITVNDWIETYESQVKR